MAGNVWEWTSDDYLPHRPADPGEGCCAPADRGGGFREQRVDPEQPAETFPRKVIKGGSHLCAPNDCFRYRPAARQGHMIDTATCHLGFRCVARGAAVVSQPR